MTAVALGVHAITNSWLANVVKQAYEKLARLPVPKALG